MAKEINLDTENTILLEIANLAKYIVREVGVYPAAIDDPNDPENSYTQRTLEMEEHNGRVSALLAALTKLSQIQKREGK